MVDNTGADVDAGVFQRSTFGRRIDGDDEDAKTLRDRGNDNDDDDEMRRVEGRMTLELREENDKAKLNVSIKFLACFRCGTKMRRDWLNL